MDEDSFVPEQIIQLMTDTDPACCCSYLTVAAKFRYSLQRHMSTVLCTDHSSLHDGATFLSAQLWIKRTHGIRPRDNPQFMSKWWIYRLSDPSWKNYRCGCDSDLGPWIRAHVFIREFDELAGTRLMSISMYLHGPEFRNVLLLRIAGMRISEDD